MVLVLAIHIQRNTATKVHCHPILYKNELKIQLNVRVKTIMP